MTRFKNSLWQYPPELRERSVRMVREAIEAEGCQRYGVIPDVASQPDVGVESLRQWSRAMRLMPADVPP
jgi:hypothetical protein